MTIVSAVVIIPIYKHIFPLFFPKLAKQITNDVKNGNDECNTNDLSDTKLNLVWDEDSDYDEIEQNKTTRNASVSD